DMPVLTWHRYNGEDDMPEDLHKAIFDDGALIEAHNKMFEELIWHFVLHKKWKWPDLPNRYDCTAARAAVMALPRSLEQLGVALKLHTQKDMTGKRTMLKLSKPRRP